MAIVYYDFDRSTNGSGSIDDAKNTWATPSNGDVIRIKPGNRWLRSTQLNLSTFTGLTFEPWPSYYDGGLPKPIITHNAASTFAWNFQGDGVHTIRDLKYEDCSSNANGGIIGCGTVAATSNGAQVSLERVDFQDISANAVRMSATGANASPTFKALACTWDNIGEDAIYGGALVYEVGYCTMTRLSQLTETGDGIGYLSAVPTRAWIHHNYIDHGKDFKHCIIVDSGTTDSGLVFIEDNTLIGFGDVSTEAAAHTVINGDAKMIVRRNLIYSAGIAINAAGNASEVYSNVIIARNIRAASPSIIALQCSNASVYNNTIYAPTLLTSGQGVVQATGESGNVVKNNLLINLSEGVRTDGGTDPTVSNNAMSNVTTPYVGGSLVAVDDTTSGLLLNNYRPKPGSTLLTNGADLGYVRDINGIQGKNYIGAHCNARFALVV